MMYGFSVCVSYLVSKYKEIYTSTTWNSKRSLPSTFRHGDKTPHTVKLHTVQISEVNCFVIQVMSTWYLMYGRLVTSCCIGKHDPNLAWNLSSTTRMELVPSWSCLKAAYKPAWHIPVPNVQWKSPDGGQRNCLKHVEFLDKNKFGKLVRLLVLLERNVLWCMVTQT